MATSPYPPAKDPEKIIEPLAEPTDSYGRIEDFNDEDMPVDDSDDEDGDGDMPDTE